MNKLKLPVTSDLFFIFIIIFLILYALIPIPPKNFILKTVTSTFLAFILTSGIAVILIKLSDKKALGFLLTKEKNNLNEYFIFLPQNATTKYFYNYYKRVYYNVTLTENKIIVSDKNLQIVPQFNYTNLTISEVLNLYREKENYNLIVLSGGFTADCYAFFTKNDVTLLNLNDVYNMLKEKNMLPNITKNEKPKQKFFSKIKMLICKKHAKFLLISGLVTLMLSPLSYFKGYYVFMGVTLLILSTICKFFGN